MSENRLNRFARMLNGGCRDCPSKAAPGHTRCRPCLRVKSTAQTARASGNVAAGLCPCGNPRSAGVSRKGLRFRSCKTCREYHRDYKKTYIPKSERT